MSWSLHQFFPVCLKPDCPKFQTRHMLQHQEDIALQILGGDENYIYWQGGVGSAKTILYAGVTAALALMIPNSRGILFRKDYELNHETLWGYFLNAIEGAFEQGIFQGSFKKCLGVKKAGKHTECKLPNGSFYKAGETKNYSRQMGPSYDVIVVSDAMENDNFGSIFHGEGTVGGLQSRLRGQASSFYRLPDGSYKDMRRFLIESNTPPNINELHTIFGKEPGVRTLTNTTVTYRHVQSNSVQNDHNPSTYAAEITSQHSDPNDIRRILGGQTVAYYGGIKVNPSFYQEIHVGSFEKDTDLPLFVGIDPGMQHPAVIFGQIRRCSYEKEHFQALSEITNLYDITTEELAEFEEQDRLGILPHLALFYPTYFDYTQYKHVREQILKDIGEEKLNSYHGQILFPYFKNILFCIDRSGNKRQPSNRDKESDRLILFNKYGIRCTYKTNIGLDRSISRVRESFKEVCICGNTIQLIDRNCQMLIDGYSGGYRYTKHRDGTHSDTPIQDHNYEDICDGHRYLLENFFFPGSLVLSEQKPYTVVPETPWSWMDSPQAG